jgi:hypothetical protein
VIRSDQGDAWKCDDFQKVLDPSYRLEVLPFDVTEIRSKLSVGFDEVCGLLADGHHYYKTFGGKPWSASALGRGRLLVSPSLGAHALNVGGFFCKSPFATNAEGTLRNFSGGRRTA